MGGVKIIREKIENNEIFYREDKTLACIFYDIIDAILYDNYKYY